MKGAERSYLILERGDLRDSFPMLLLGVTTLGRDGRFVVVGDRILFVLPSDLIEESEPNDIAESDFAILSSALYSLLSFPSTTTRLLHLSVHFEVDFGIMGSMGRRGVIRRSIGYSPGTVCRGGETDLRRSICCTSSVIFSLSWVFVLLIEDALEIFCSNKSSPKELTRHVIPVVNCSGISKGYWHASRAVNINPVVRLSNVRHMPSLAQ